MFLVWTDDHNAFLSPCDVNRHDRPHEREVGWLPIEWAERPGSPGTLARVVWLFGPAGTSVDRRRLLRTYLRRMSGNYFGGGSLERSARRAWEQVHQGYVYPFSKDEPDFVLDEEAKKDLAHLMAQAGISSVESPVSLVVEE